MARSEPELALHKAVAQFLDAALPPDATWLHVPNGGKRSKAEAGKLKAMGVRAGWPDITILYGGRLFCVELKADGGRLSPKQRGCLNRIDAAGGAWCIARSVSDIQEFLRGFSIPLRTTVTA